MVVIGELSVSPASVSILLLRLSCSSVSAFFTGMTHAHFESAIQLLYHHSDSMGKVLVPFAADSPSVQYPSDTRYKANAFSFE